MAGTKQAHAQVFSLGGGILVSILLLFVTLFAVSFTSSFEADRLKGLLLILVLMVILYFVDSLSEVLVFQNGTVFFDSLLKRRRSIDLNAVDQIFFIHQGLNLEHGIESLIFRRANGDEISRFDLGPLWRRRSIEVFLREVEGLTGHNKLVEQV